ncbi:hypothetical protein [Nocardioides pantholopis]|uniref:hypothetical protein n=1 Tax=Nocardioides pantholopis TaxID=2483798 RepID=UPI000F08FB26|nr:hypothetical protein [Nocardioides pantholopis]
MELIPESAQAAELFGPFLTPDNEDLLDQLVERVSQVQDLIPDCVGVSVASMQEGITFTVVASHREVAVLDAVQYIAGRPPMEGADDPGRLEDDESNPLDETRWQVFAQATAAHAVASTLTLPIITGSDVLGCVNLYAATKHAFTGHHEEIAHIFEAWAPGAVTNADLEFSTRHTAQQAPTVLREKVRIAMAVGWLAESHRLEVDEARELFDQAVLRTGVTPAELAETLLAGRAAEDEQD